MATKEISNFKKPYDFYRDKDLPFRYTPTPSGKPIEDVYGYEIDSYGRKVLVKTGETDLYAKIQESLEETKIENILARAAIGDNSVFRPDGIYADLTEMPSNLIEARQSIQKMENLWAGIPNEIKAKYNYDVGEFIGKAGTDGWLKDMGLYEGSENIEMVNTAPAEGQTDLKGETNE